MQRHMRLSIGSILALSLGCGSASATGSGAGGNALSLQGGSDEAPAVFTARQHPPRVRPAPSPVDVSQLDELGLMLKPDPTRA